MVAVTGSGQHSVLSSVHSRRAVLGLGVIGVAGGVLGCTVPTGSPGQVTGPAFEGPDGEPSPAGPPDGHDDGVHDGEHDGEGGGENDEEQDDGEGPSGEAGATREEIVEALGGVDPLDWGLNLPGTLVRTDLDTVAITLDACGGPQGNGVDTTLLQVLRDHEVPATLFLNARWRAENPGVADELVDDPLFDLACHGDRHVPLSVTGRAAYGITGTADVGEVVDEIIANDDWFIQRTGAISQFTRPGTAYTDDVAIRAAQKLGRTIAGFSINGDGGAQFSAADVAAALDSSGPGDIILAHMNQPSGGTAQGFAQALPGLLDRGVRFGYLT